MTARGYVEDAFDISGRGLVLVVRLTEGRVSVGADVRCAGQVGTLAGIEMISRRVPAKPPENTGILVTLPHPKKQYIGQEIVFSGGANDP